MRTFSVNFSAYPKQHGFKIEVCDEISQIFLGPVILLKTGPVSLFEFNII